MTEMMKKDSKKFSFWVGWEVLHSIPKKHKAKKWPDGVTGWFSGSSEIYDTFVGRVDATSAEEAEAIIRGIYGKSAGLIVSRWEPRQNELGWMPGGDRFPPPETKARKSKKKSKEPKLVSIKLSIAEYSLLKDAAAGAGLTANTYAKKSLLRLMENETQMAGESKKPSFLGSQMSGDDTASAARHFCGVCDEEMLQDLDVAYHYYGTISMVCLGCASSGAYSTVVTMEDELKRIKTEKKARDCDELLDLMAEGEHCVSQLLKGGLGDSKYVKELERVEKELALRGREMNAARIAREGN